jgi:hypothetical protein
LYDLNKEEEEFRLTINNSPSNPDFSSAEARLSLVICSFSFLVGSLHTMIPIHHRGLELLSSIKKKKVPGKDQSWAQKDARH